MWQIKIFSKTRVKILPLRLIWALLQGEINLSGRYYLQFHRGLLLKERLCSIYAPKWSKFFSLRESSIFKLAWTERLCSIYALKWSKFFPLREPFIFWLTWTKSRNPCICVHIYVKFFKTSYFPNHLMDFIYIRHVVRYRSSSFYGYPLLHLLP